MITTCKVCTDTEQYSRDERGTAPDTMTIDRLPVEFPRLGFAL